MPCKFGFIYDSTQQVCQCILNADIVCPPPYSTTMCVRYGHWYGFDSNTRGSITLPCPGQNCRYDGRCPNNDSCENSPDFCHLTESYNLCYPGRDGISCSECKTNYSFTFGALSCVPSSTCHTRYTAYILLGIVFYSMIFISIVLNLSMGSGFIYGIVYYFSMINLFTDSTLNDQFLQVVIRTCVALTQVDPYFFGDITICFTAFSESMNLNLHHQLFRLVTPFFCHKHNSGCHLPYPILPLPFSYILLPELSHSCYL